MKFNAFKAQQAVVVDTRSEYCLLLSIFKGFVSIVNFFATFSKPSMSRYSFSKQNLMLFRC